MLSQFGEVKHILLLISIGDNYLMNQALTVEQVDFFRDNGYLILPNMLDPELMAQTRDAWWDAAPPEPETGRSGDVGGRVL